MKYCKGNCGKPLGLMQGNYCEECKKRLPLRDQLIEDSWKTDSYFNGEVTK